MNYRTYTFIFASVAVVLSAHSPFILGTELTSSTQNDTECSALMTGNVEKLLKLVQLWIKYEGTTEAKRIQFIEKTLSQTSPTNPFIGWVGSESAQLESAGDLLIDMSQQEWTHFKEQLKILFENELKEIHQIENIDEVTATIFSASEEASLSGGYQSFYNKPYWIKTPSGRTFVFVNRLPSNRVKDNIEYQLFEYNSESRSFHLLSNLQSLYDFQSKNKFETIRPLIQAIDEDSIVFQLSGSEKNTLARVNISDDKLSILDSYKGIPSTDVALLDGKLYYTSISKKLSQYETYTVGIKFFQLDTATQNRVLLNTSRVELKKFHLFSKINNGVIQWFNNFEPSPNELAEFDPKTNQFKIKWLETKIEEIPAQSGLVGALSRMIPTLKKTKLHHLMEVITPYTYVTKDGKNLRTDSYGTHISLKEIDPSNGEANEIIRLPFQYDSIKISESPLGALFITTLYRVPFHDVSVLSILSVDLDKKEYVEIGNIDIDQPGPVQYILHTNRDGRFFIVANSYERVDDEIGERELSIMEFNETDETLYQVSSVQFSNFSILDEKAVIDVQKSNQSQKIIGISKDGTLKVFRID